VAMLVLRSWSVFRYSVATLSFLVALGDPSIDGTLASVVIIKRNQVLEGGVMFVSCLLPFFISTMNVRQVS